MKDKGLWRISVATTLEAEDAVAEMLGAILSLPASSYFDVESQVSIVSVFCTGKTGLMSAATAPHHQKIHEAILTGLKRIQNSGLKIGSGKITIGRLRREDWAESWKRHFKPIEIGDALLIKPSWSRRRARKNQAVVVLDPGLSFGTGHHPTTAFCLRELARHSAKRTAARRSFLDIGTGSGILTIAAAKLGFAPVHAMDWDAGAVRVTRANARANGVLKQLRLMRGDLLKLPLRSDWQYDLICANLTATLLIAGRRRIVNRLRPDGMLVLAGVLALEFSRVQKAFERLGLKRVASQRAGEWRSGSFGFAQKV
jgi:ribosomal protein L11 methyltransferase